MVSIVSVSHHYFEVFKLKLTYLSNSSMEQRYYQYLLLISVAISILTVTRARRIGLTCEEPCCRFSVLITIKCPNDCKPIGIGGVLNHKWILTAHVVVMGIKSAKEENMIVIAGDKRPINQLKQFPVTKIYINDATQIKFPATVALLELEKSILFGPVIGELIFAYEHAKKKFDHCELISITIEDSTKIVTKSLVPVEVLFKGQSGCPIQDKNLVCIKSLLRHKRQNGFVNPCEAKTTIGSTLMCNIGLEGIFIGNENGKGCDPLPSPNQNRAIYFIRPSDPNVNWIEPIIKPDDINVTDFTDNLISATRGLTKPSTKFPIPGDGESSTSSSTESSSTETSSPESIVTESKSPEGNSTESISPESNSTESKSPENTESSSAESGSTGSINTGIIGASTIGPSKNATPGSNTTLPSLDLRIKKWKIPKCSSGFRHDQLISIVLCIVVFEYVI